MKIGILSMQEIKNYGSFLQAFSLKKNIEALGHTCEFINIIPGEQLAPYKIPLFYKYRILFKRIWGWDFIKRSKYIYKYQKRFKFEFLPELGVKNYHTTEYFDTVVIGSDEVFNCAQRSWFGFSKQLFGYNLNTNKIITYAASFGATNYNILKELNIDNTISNLLININKISVRDANSVETIKSLTGITPEKHVDPVLIFNYDSYIPTIKNLGDYMIVYTYPNRITSPEEISAIRTYAHNKKLKLISIGHYFPWCDMTIIPHPFEVLAYFKYANCIVTDTFHGTIFSIKYNKQFCTIIRDMNSNKLTHLLKQFNLSDRIITDIKMLPNILDTIIDYTPTNIEIQKEKKRSIEYLKNNL